MKAVFIALAVVAVTGCTSAQTATADQAAAQGPDAVVGEVGGRKITLKEVDDRWQSLNAAERARITQLLYQNRRNVLEQIMGDILIENAAKAANKSTADFVQEESQKRVTPVSDADVQQFFEANKERAQGRTIDELREPIRQFLVEQRKQQARAQLAGELSTKAGGVRVLLDPPRESINIAATDMVRGPATAPITIVEYSDYQCPFCARVNPTLDRVRQTYGDRVRIVFKDFPLPIHPEAPKASEAAYCAGEQGKYWEMHDRMFANQQALQVPALKQHAASIGLDTNAFNQCLDSGKHTTRVADNLKSGEKLGIGSTPTLYVNGRPVVGAQPFEYFKTVIDEELARITGK
jgi:protein-disulfide isomerase